MPSGPGVTWSRLAGTTGADFHYVNDLVLSQTSPATTIYAATRTGLWRSMRDSAEAACAAQLNESSLTRNHMTSIYTINHYS